MFGVKSEVPDFAKTPPDGSLKSEGPRQKARSQHPPMFEKVISIYSIRQRAAAGRANVACLVCSSTAHHGAHISDENKDQRADACGTEPDRPRGRSRCIRWTVSTQA